jgi:hypothetical protein
MKYYQNRFQQIVSFDEIRIGKVIEIFQFSLVFTVLAIIGSYITNEYLLFDFHGSENILHIFLTLSIELAVLTLLVFYLRKVTLLVPSLAAILFTNFKPYTTIELGMWMILVFVLIGGLDKINYKVKLLNKKFNKLINKE